MKHVLSLKQALWLFGGLCFTVVGVTLSRHWSSDPIHIYLSEGHGLETQDFVIFIPTLIATVWLSAKLWHHHQTIRAWIRHSPEKAVLVALIAGILSGMAFGTLFGAVFAPLVKSLVKLLHRLISP